MGDAAPRRALGSHQRASLLPSRVATAAGRHSHSSHMDGCMTPEEATVKANWGTALWLRAVKAEAEVARLRKVLDTIVNTSCTGGNTAETMAEIACAALAEKET